MAIEAELSSKMKMSGFSSVLSAVLIRGANNKKAIEAIAKVLKINKSLLRDKGNSDFF